MSQESFRIYLDAYDHKLLDQSSKKIVDVVEKTGSKVVGPVPLPTKIKRYTVIRSPHVNKKSREQFEIRTHKRMLEVNDSNPKIISSLTALSLPAGVGIEIKQNIKKSATARRKS